MVPQSIPAGVLMTVPMPAPAVVTLRTTVGVKVAVTAVAAVSVTVHVPVPVQAPPLQPVKTEVGLGGAVSVTIVPLVEGAEQAAPQAMPAGAVVTAPAAVP